jgi:hypothetical protein
VAGGCEATALDDGAAGPADDDGRAWSPAPGEGRGLVDDVDAPVPEPDVLDSFALHRRLSVRPGALGDDVEDFPVLVRLSGVTSDAIKGGADLAFFDAGGVEVPFDIEAITTTETFAWVRVPRLHPEQETVLWAAWGSHDLDAGPGVDVVDLQWRAAVWDSSFAAVWHLGLNGTTQTPDVTSNGHDGHLSSTLATTSSRTAAPAGVGMAFRNDFDGVAIDGLAGTRVDAGFTIEAYVNPNVTTGAVLSLFASDDPFLDGAFPVLLNVLDVGGYEGVSFSVASALFPAPDLFCSVDLHHLDNGGWMQVVGMYEPSAGGQNGAMSLFVNGELCAAGFAFAPLPLASGTVGNAGALADVFPVMQGVVDEVRFSRRVLSPAWVRAAYESWSRPDFVVESL